VKPAKPLLSVWAITMSTVAVIAVSGQEQLDLRLRLKQGQTYRQAVIVDASIEQGPSGSGQKSSMRTGPGMRYRVGKVHGGGRMEARVEYEWFSVRVAAPDGRIDYDSRTHKGAVPIFAQAFASLINQGFDATFESNGSVQALQGVEEMVENIVRRLEVPNGPARDALERSARQQFSQAGVRQMMESAFVFPTQTVGIGDSWRKVVTAPGSSMAVENVYTLLKREGGKAFVSVAAQIGIDTTAQAPGGPNPVQMAISGSQQGELVVNEATGWLIGGQIVQDVTGTMQGFPVKMNTVTKLAGQ